MLQVHELDVALRPRPQLEIEGNCTVCYGIDDGRVAVRASTMRFVSAQYKDSLRRAEVHAHELKQGFETRHVDQVAFLAQNVS